MPDDRTFDDPRPPKEEEWGAPLGTPRSAPDVERTFRRRVGSVSGVVPYVAPHPWLYRPFLFLAAPALTATDGEFATSLSFIIARDNSCRFCYSIFRALLRLSNHSPATLEELETHFSTQDFGEEEEWGFRLAVRLSRCTTVPEAIERLQSMGMTASAIREIKSASVHGWARGTSCPPTPSRPRSITSAGRRGRSTSNRCFSLHGPRFGTTLGRSSARPGRVRSTLTGRVLWRRLPPSALPVRWRGWSSCLCSTTHNSVFNISLPRESAGRPRWCALSF